MPSGAWSGDRTEAGAGRRTPLPATTLRSLDDALDCDLGKCPFTNVMPIRRLVRDGPVGEWVGHDIACVKVPSLKVVPIVQHYRVVEAGAARGDRALPGIDGSDPRAQDGRGLRRPRLSVPGRTNRVLSPAGQGQSMGDKLVDHFGKQIIDNPVHHS